MASTAQSNPFIKQLAANDRKTRDKALDSLRTYLSSHRSFTPLDLLKLWKGLFFCMWHSDRPRVQQQLALDLASLVDVLPSDTVIPFQRAFWQTMAREWKGIDVLRMNKYLFLVRQYLNAAFRVLARQNWKNGEVIEETLAMLEETPLSAKDVKVPDGMRYHVVDIYVDELDKVDEARKGEMPLERMLGPLRKLGEQSPNKKVRERVKESLGDERLQDWLQVRGEEDGFVGAAEAREQEDARMADGEDEDEDDEWGGIED